MKKAHKENQGFTLIELLVTLALIGLVIVGGAQLYFFANRSFVSGTITADIHSDVQLAMQRMTNELRLAHKIEFGKTIPSSGLGGDDHYLFTNNKGEVVLRTTRGDEILTPSASETGKYKLNFAKIAGVGDMLRVELSSLNQKLPYDLSSEIQVLNARLDGFSGTSPNATIFFTKTLSPVEKNEAEVIRRRCILSTVVFNDQDPDLDVFRDFRDKKLANTKFGRLLTRVYYSTSPFISELLVKIPPILVLTRLGFQGLALHLRWQSEILTVFMILLFASFTILAYYRLKQKPGPSLG